MGSFKVGFNFVLHLYEHDLPLVPGGSWPLQLIRKLHTVFECWSHGLGVMVSPWHPDGTRMSIFCLGSPTCIDCDAVEFALCICVHFIPRTDAGLCSYFFQQDQIRKPARGYSVWKESVFRLFPFCQERDIFRGCWDMTKRMSRQKVQKGKNAFC